MGFRIAQVAELARQMGFTPAEQRARQLTAAENLLFDLQEEKAYPFDFVVFRITGYHSKRTGSETINDEGFTGQLLTGLALRHDLGLLIENVSDTLNLTVAQTAERVLTSEDVCREFNVCDKSVQRWRRRGLVGRRFIFADGKKRVGFLVSSAERFFSQQSGDLAISRANFSPVTTDETRRIIAHARRLAASGCWVEWIRHRVERAFNRSPLTITDILGKIELHAPAKPEQAERDRIIAAFERGRRPAQLAREFGRPRPAIHRIVIERHIGAINHWDACFIDDPIYHSADAEAAIADIVGAEEMTAAAQKREEQAPRGLTPYFQALFKQPILSAAKERALFLKMHFHRFQFISVRQELEDKPIRWQDVRRLDGYLRQAIQTKNRIVAANLRLIVNVARKHQRASITLMDLVSDGNVALMRAADTFDVHKGNRFSTYVSFALMKEFARSAWRGAHRTCPASLDALVAEVADPRMAARTKNGDERSDVRDMLSSLDEREQIILREHYGLAENEPRSFEEIGRALKLSKQYVRRIEKKAIARLRAKI